MLSALKTLSILEKLLLAVLVYNLWFGHLSDNIKKVNCLFTLLLSTA
jgi:hypothetical protein